MIPPEHIGAPATGYEKESRSPVLSSAITPDLVPLLEESLVALGLRHQQATVMTASMQAAWLWGAKQACVEVADLLETPEVRQTKSLSLELGLRNLMESTTSALGLSTEITLETWIYLARARLIGRRFCEGHLLAALDKSKA